jgi:homoserine dehydrogenase
VGGIDADHKLSLLAAIAFSTRVSFDAVEAGGDQGRCRLLTSLAMRSMGYRIKLLGVAQMTGRELEQRMTPCLVPPTAQQGRLQAAPTWSCWR